MDADLRPPLDAPPRPRELDFDEDFAAERADEDFFAEERPVDEARPVVRLEEPRPEDGPAVRPVDFADELRGEELRLEEPRELELDLPEELEPDFFDEAEVDPDLLPVDLECDFDAGREPERLELLPLREDDELPRDDLEDLLPRERAFSG